MSSRYYPPSQFTMLRLLPAFAFLLFLLPTFISAQCAACDSYTAALQSCQTTNVNVTAVGATMDSTAIQCMCTSKSGATEMNACLVCEESNANSSLDTTVLLAWTNTCSAEGQFGDQQAATCWESQPNNELPCFSQTDGNGGTSGGISGSDIAPANASSG